MMRVFAQGLLASEKRIRGVLCLESCDGHPQFQSFKWVVKNHQPEEDSRQSVRLFGKPTVFLTFVEVSKLPFIF